ncbi:MAG: hypothetical protein CM1200mP27_13610 [Chloroflexota bacterium]|nr:MAG: hypothetical protein CM1200mP27_13610 [Chloroflexota bacterium]
MAIYELRTYTLYVGKMGKQLSFTAKRVLACFGKRWFRQKVSGLLHSDVGTINQLVHLWRFDNDADRRNHWATLFSDGPFMAFGAKIRPLLMTQEVKVMLEAPLGGPHP